MKKIIIPALIICALAAIATLLSCHGYDNYCLMILLLGFNPFCRIIEGCEEIKERRAARYGSY